MTAACAHRTYINALLCNGKKQPQERRTAHASLNALHPNGNCVPRLGGFRGSPRTRARVCGLLISPRSRLFLAMLFTDVFLSGNCEFPMLFDAIQEGDANATNGSIAKKKSAKKKPTKCN
jgi:hypothetical protein